MERGVSNPPPLTTVPSRGDCARSARLTSRHASCCRRHARNARDKYDHFALRSLLQSLGISLRSATEPIDDTSTGKLMEGVPVERERGSPDRRDVAGGSSFASTDEASAFFETGSLGYSATGSGQRLDGITLRTASWNVEPLDVEYVRSCYFADPRRFPDGSITFACGLLMRNIEHEWIAAPQMPVARASYKSRHDRAHRAR